MSYTDTYMLHICPARTFACLSVAASCSRLDRFLLVGRFLEDFVIAAFAICAIWIA